jgi:RNA polymerase sigma factor (sigma-70 family)
MDLRRLLEAHQNAVYGVCLRVLRHPQDAEDACQDALVEAARHAPSLRDPRAFGPWLRRVALTTALDLRRKRERRRLRDASLSLPVPAAEPSIELHQALAELDDDTRYMLLEHYYEGRPLRTLASEAGVSEAAISKRLEKGRERLKARLGAAAFGLLGAGALSVAPDGLAAKALATLEGTALMKKVAIAALLLLPPALVGGAAVLARRSAPPPAEAPAAVDVPPPAAKPVSLAPSHAPDVGPPVQAAPPARRPWPLEFPPPEWPEGVKRAWEALTRKTTIDLQNVPLADLLAEISRDIQYPIVLVAGHGREMISFKVSDIVGDGALRLALTPRQMAYEIGEDGTVLVTRADQARTDRWGAGRIHQDRHELERTRRQLKTSEVLPSLRTAEEGLRRDVAAFPGARTLEDALTRLRSATGVNLILDYQVAEKVRLDRAVPPIAGGSLESVLLLMLDGEGLVPVPTTEGIVLLTSRERAAAHQRDPLIQAARRFDDALDRPLGWRGSFGVADIATRMESELGVRVIATREAWEGAGELRPGEDETARAFLDRLGALGVRWSVRNGMLFLIR